jgi:hypothetical protein
MATIKVTAGAGRTVPLHSSVATAPGARLKLLVAPEVIEVDDTNVHVQRSLADGDLIKATDAPSPSSASSPTPAPAPVAKEG